MRNHRGQQRPQSVTVGQMESQLQPVYAWPCTVPRSRADAAVSNVSTASSSRSSVSFFISRPVRLLAMNAQNWISLVSVIATAAIAILSLLLSRRRERQQQERDDRLRREQQERDDRLRREQQQREEEIRAAERHLVPRTDVTIDCHFYGPEGDHLIAELLLTVNNKGSTQRKFASIEFRMRVLREGAELRKWRERRSERLYFPEKILDEDIVPEGEHYYFVEPGVEQVFTFVTMVPKSIRYVLAHASLTSVPLPHENREENVFTAERLFPVRASPVPT